jgi:hypothetical protein
VPDNWDGASDFHVRFTYAMTTSVAANVRLDMSGDGASVATGAVAALPSNTFLIAVPADTDVHRTTVAFSISGIGRTPGDSILVATSRPSSDGLDTHTGDWQVLAATVYIGQGGTTPVNVGTTIDVVARTVDATLVADDSGSLQTNRGAGALVTLSLPAGGGLAIGTNVIFRRVAAFAFRVDPQIGDNLNYSGGSMDAGEYLEMASAAATFRTVWDGVEWLVDLENGTLTEETP